MQYSVLQMRFTVAQTITTSIRLPVQLRKQLEMVSRLKNEGKNGMIIEALKNYFQKFEKLDLVQEARRQSLLASKNDKDGSLPWEDNLDIDDWKR